MAGRHMADQPSMRSRNLSPQIKREKNIFTIVFLIVINLFSN